MSKPTKPPENVGTVPVNSGLSSNGKAYGGTVASGKFVPNASAQLVREQDPTGAIVVHAVRRSAYVHERLHSLSGQHKLADELYDAAEKFRIDFERAQLSGNYARLDLFSSRSGKVDMSDNLALAKGRVAKVFQALGNGGQEPSLSQSCVWNVVGLGITLEEWTAIVRDSGKGMNSDKASGIFHVSLERLALHYGMVDMGRLQSMSNERAYARAIVDFFEFAAVATATLQGTEKSAVGKFIAATRRRFDKVCEN